MKAKNASKSKASSYGYPFGDWVAKEDPESIAAREPMGELSIGTGKSLKIKCRKIVIIGILAFRGRKDGGIAHMKRAIPPAAVQGGGPTFSVRAQVLMELDQAGAIGK